MVNYCMTYVNFGMKIFETQMSIDDFVMHREFQISFVNSKDTRNWMS